VGKGLKRCAWTSPKGSDDEISVLGKWRDALKSRGDILEAQVDSRDDSYFFLCFDRPDIYLTLKLKLKLKLTTPASQFSLSLFLRNGQTTARSVGNGRANKVDEAMSG